MHSVGLLVYPQWPASSWCTSAAAEAIRYDRLFRLLHWRTFRPTIGVTMHTVGLVVYPNFQALGLSSATVFEYANLLSGKTVYEFHLVSEEGGPVITSQGFAVVTERLG